MSGYGPQYRPKKQPSHATVARWAQERKAADEYERERTARFAAVGGWENAAVVAHVNLPLFRALHLTVVNGPDTWWSSHADALLCACVRRVTGEQPRHLEKLGKRLRKHLPAIRAALAMGDGVDEVVYSMIRKALHR